MLLPSLLSAAGTSLGKVSTPTAPTNICFPHSLTCVWSAQSRTPSSCLTSTRTASQTPASPWWPRPSWTRAPPRSTWLGKDSPPTSCSMPRTSPATRTGWRGECWPGAQAGPWLQEATSLGVCVEGPPSPPQWVGLADWSLHQAPTLHGDAARGPGVVCRETRMGHG